MIISQDKYGNLNITLSKSEATVTGCFKSEEYDAEGPFNICINITRKEKHPAYAEACKTLRNDDQDFKYNGCTISVAEDGYSVTRGKWRLDVAYVNEALFCCDEFK